MELRVLLLVVALLVGWVTAQGDSPRPTNLVTPNGPIVDSTKYTAPGEPKYDYVDVMHKSFLFYWAQRSGKMPYQRLAWRSDSCLDCKGDFGEDLSGGWYEAANTMKWGGPFAFSAFQLAWNVYEFSDAMKKVNEYNEAIHWVRQGADYLLNTYTANATHERLVGVYGVSALDAKTDIDFGYFGPPEEYLQGVPGNYPRRAFYCTGGPGLNQGCSDIAGDYAAALAAAAVVLKDVDAAYAQRCSDTARQIYGFATKYLNSYQTATVLTGVGWNNYRQWYPSNGYDDELALASTWLHLATGDAAYLTQARAHLAKNVNLGEYSWADKGIAAYVQLYRITKDAALSTPIDTFFKAWLPGGSIPRTPRGLAFLYEWGSLRYSANVAFVALAHRQTLTQLQPTSTQLTPLWNFAVQQINYMLGDCGRSWIPGFGENYPKLPYHKSSYNSYIDYPMRGRSQGEVGQDFLTSPTPNRFILYGALVGGPTNTDTYIDNRQSYEFTEVTQDYNAAFTGALAGLVHFYSPAKFKSASDCTLDLGWTHPNATISNRPAYKPGDCYHACGECTLQNVSPDGSPAPAPSSSSPTNGESPASSSAARPGPTSLVADVVNYAVGNGMKGLGVAGVVVGVSVLALFVL
ncbi:family 9 glycoside hydrolase [Phlyctochytrium arcticum]|nr:family 9 glycoside hydrolase [Phlyctochytrium arcticum]